MVFVLMIADIVCPSAQLCSVKRTAYLIRKLNLISTITSFWACLTDERQDFTTGKVLRAVIFR